MAPFQIVLMLFSLLSLVIFDRFAVGIHDNLTKRAKPHAPG
jgi:hypothetical protein